MENEMKCISMYYRYYHRNFKVCRTCLVPSTIETTKEYILPIKFTTLFDITYKYIEPTVILNILGTITVYTNSV